MHENNIYLIFVIPNDFTNDYSGFDKVGRHFPRGKYITRKLRKRHVGLRLFHYMRSGQSSHGKR